MSDPLVVRLANQFRQELIGREALAVAEMSRRWLSVEELLFEDMVRLAEALAEEQIAGRSISKSKLYRMDRYQRLLAQLGDQLRRFNMIAGQRIEKAALMQATRGLEDALSLINAVVQPFGENVVNVIFDRLGVEAAENITAIARAGQPLEQILQRNYPLAVDAITDRLIKSTAAGINPRETARRMRNEGLAEGLNHILLVSRDQEIRSYREATRQQYLKTGVVDGYRRLAAKQPGRTCLACIALDGTVYPTDELMELHPQDRCSMVPNVRGFQPPQWLAGEDYFKSLDPEQQREWMGPRRFELWQAGKFEFRQMAKIHHDPTWGDSAQVRSVKDLERLSRD